MTTTMMTRGRWWLAGVLALTTQFAKAADETGVVQARHGEIKPRMVLMGDDQETAVRLCEGPLDARLVKFEGMQIKVSGDWQEPKAKGGERCLLGKSLMVLKTSSGRDAVTGTLVAKAEGLFIDKGNGTTVAVPVDKSAVETYKGLIGSKVIADIKQFTSGPKLVSLIAHP